MRVKTWAFWGLHSRQGKKQIHTVIERMPEVWSVKETVKYM